jgi:dipeptidase E
MKVLALSSSRAGKSGFLEKAVPYIKSFLGTHPLQIAFVPFATVQRDYDTYGEMVANALKELDHNITLVNEENGSEVLSNANVVMIGGGNTFKLLHDLYHFNLFNLINDKIRSGIPYIGWSAGANLAGKTICTTNDMPIIQPASFEAFGFFPFQINPHYVNQVQEGFHGETRDQRIAEYLHLNKDKLVVGLPEGSALQLINGELRFKGEQAGSLFSFSNGEATRTEIPPNADLQALIASYPPLP